MMSGNTNPAGNPIIRNVSEKFRTKDELDRFKDLAKKIVQVPKSEIDEKRKK